MGFPDPPPPRRPDDGRAVRWAGVVFVLSLALFAAATYWIAEIADTPAERRWAGVAALIPLAISAGTLRQLVHRQWKAHRRAAEEEPRRSDGK